MRRIVPPLLRLAALAGLVLPLGACGLFFDGEEREAWRGQAEAACFARREVVPGPQASLIREIDGPGVCGIERPLKVAAAADGGFAGSVAVVPGATLGCPMTAALERWMAGVVQPAALAAYGVPVVSVKNAASYGCRTRNHKRGARLSEHAFANALDIAAFTLADGRSVTIAGGWRGEAADRTFLRRVHDGACGPFSTVLGPGSDGMHEDHLHLDLAFRRSGEPYCRPKPLPVAPPTLEAVPAPAPGLDPGSTPAPYPGPGVPMAVAPAYPDSVGAAPLVWQQGAMPPLLPPPEVTGSVR